MLNKLVILAILAILSSCNKLATTPEVPAAPQLCTVSVARAGTTIACINSRSYFIPSSQCAITTGPIHSRIVCPGNTITIPNGGTTQTNCVIVPNPLKIVCDNGTVVAQ